MKTIELRVAITLDEKEVLTMGEVVRQISESLPRRTTSVERSQHALLQGQKPPDDRGLLIDSRQAAELLGISACTLWGMQSSGRMPKPIRIGRAVRWSYEELQSWIRDGCPPPDRRRFDR